MDSCFKIPEMGTYTLRCFNLYPGKGSEVKICLYGEEEAGYKGEEPKEKKCPRCGGKLSISSFKLLDPDSDYDD